MSLRPIVLLTACLLGACERKDGAAGSAPPDLAETRSSLRDPERRVVVTRREREGKPDAVELIRRFASGATSWLDAAEAIAAADPSEFDVIWRALSTLEPASELWGETVPLSRRLQLLAIYHLAARNDLVAAGRITREILLPLCAEEERLSMLEGLLQVFSRNQDEKMLVSYIDFMREASPEERQELEKKQTAGWIGPDELSYLVNSDQRLNSQETRMILSVFAIRPFGERGVEMMLTAPEMKEIHQYVWDIVKEGEKNGVFEKGAGDMYLNVAGIFQGDWYLEVVPLEKLEAMLRMEGGDLTVEGIVLKDISRSFLNAERLREEGGFDLEGSDSGVPATFFTPTGIRYLPEERYVDAILAWHRYADEKAEAWFANATDLTPSQRDLVRAALAKKEDGLRNEEKSQEWLGQISDLELRERTVWEIKGPAFDEN